LVFRIITFCFYTFDSVPILNIDLFRLFLYTEQNYGGERTKETGNISLLNTC